MLKVDKTVAGAIYLYDFITEVQEIFVKWGKNLTVHNLFSFHIFLYSLKKVSDFLLPSEVEKNPNISLF